jgi:8-oxo-dGTP pyrophosphatase MutT (NUDIX family)
MHWHKNTDCSSKQSLPFKFFKKLIFLQNYDNMDSTEATIKVDMTRPSKTKKGNPVIPKPAATVILVRQHLDELQVYLLKRSAKSGFMAGNYVFPGGTVDAEDQDSPLWKNWVDLDTNGIVKRLGGNLGVEEALAFSVAAVRETLEEAGVFLANSQKANTQELKRICQLRLTPDLPKKWFQKLAVSEEWTLTLSRLYRWSHWITPQLMSRRFDTRFFLAAMPSNQVCHPDSRETTGGLWINPQKGLAGNLEGKIPLSPPTVITLHELSQYQSLDDLMEAAKVRRWGKPMLPRLIPLEKGAIIVEPWDSLYGHKEIHINIEKLSNAVLPVGKSFSRIWYHDGVWRPVKTQA